MKSGHDPIPLKIGYKVDGRQDLLLLFLVSSSTTEHEQHGSTSILTHRPGVKAQKT